jgi:uncharacterized membrane protein
MILSPAFFLNVGWNFGRFDFVNFAILYFALVNAKRRNYLAPSLLSSLAICIHEAFLFYGIPLIAASIVKYADGKPTRRFIKFAFLPVFVSIYLFLYGSSTDVNALAANRPLIQYQSFDWLNYSVSIYYVLFSSLMYIKLIPLSHVRAIYIRS